MRIKERAGNNFLISNWRLGGSPDPAVCWTVESPAGLGVGDLRSAKWQGQETLPQLGDSWRCTEEQDEDVSYAPRGDGPEERQAFCHDFSQ